MAFLIKSVIDSVGKVIYKNKIRLGRNTRFLNSYIMNNHLEQNKKIPVQNMEDVKTELKEISWIQSDYMSNSKSRTYLLDYLPKSQSELEPRTIQESFSSVLIPLSTNNELQYRYNNFLGGVRLDKLLDDMDLFAAYIVYKYIKNLQQTPNIPSPYYVVTVLIDKINFTNFKPASCADIRLSGHVSCVGKSSVEVLIWLEQMKCNKWQEFTRALFLMAARDATLIKPAIVNSLKPTNKEEEQIIRNGLLRNKRRAEFKKQSLFELNPTDEEQKIIHDLFIRTMRSNNNKLLKPTLPPGCVWMQNSTMSNLIFCHPEYKNLHNKISGGFLMRQAVELSSTLAYSFSKYRPELKHISDINFYKPVEINSLIKMHGYIVYTTMHYIQITVYAEHFDVSTGIYNTTNDFHFTYEIPELAPEILPKTYHETIMYLDGRRYFIEANKSFNSKF